MTGAGLEALAALVAAGMLGNGIAWVLHRIEQAARR